MMPASLFYVFYLHLWGIIGLGRGEVAQIILLSVEDLAWSTDRWLKYYHAVRASF